MAHDVFLSYSTKDRLAADAACNVLERNRVRVWMAPRDIVPGTNWPEAIVQAIDSTRVMVLIVSASANSSPDVESEVRVAIDNRVPVLPFRVEDVKLKGSLDYFTRTTHWLDAFDPPLEQHLERLVTAVKRLLETDYVRREQTRVEPVREPGPNNLVQPSVGMPIQDFDGAPRLVQVPPGRFMMGSPVNERGRDANEGPLHEVELKRGFAIGIFPVTFSDWAIARAQGGVDYDPNPKKWGLGNQPVINVSWEDANKYCAWLSSKTKKAYRLPTEAEWEYSARACTTTPFWWGDDISTNEANYDGLRKRPVPVDFTGFEPNPWGLYQMHGNVWEWCEDNWFANYKDASGNGAARVMPVLHAADRSEIVPSRPKILSAISVRWSSDSVHAPLRVVRGGSWTLTAKDLRSARRGYYMQNYRGDTIGFRIVRDL